MLTLRRRLAAGDEAGVTLIEVMVTILIGMVVLVGMLTLFDSGARSSARTIDRADVTQRGRLAINAITRPLRSQVCKDSQTPPVAAGSDTSVTFYADTDESSGFVARAVRIYFDSTWKGGRGAIRQDTYPGTDTTVTPARTNVLVEDVALQPGKTFLSYYSFDGTAKMTTPLSSVTTNPSTTTALPANSIAKVLRTDVAFRVAPSVASNKTGALSGNQLDALRDSDFQAQVFVRNSDYTDQAAANNDRLWGPRCT